MNPLSSHRSSRKKILFFLGITGFLLGLLFLTPSILSTQWGNRQLSSFLSQKIAGSVSAKKMQFSWLGPQEIEGLALYDSEQDIVLNAAYVKADMPLIHLLEKKFSTGKLHADGLNITLSEEQIDRINISHDFGLNTAHGSPLTIFLKDVAFDLHSGDSNKGLYLTVQGNTEHLESAGKFSIELAADQWTWGDLTAQMKELLSAKTSASVKAEVTDFPVAFLDHATTLANSKFAGVLRELLGDRLTFSFHKSVNASKANFHLLAEAPLLSAKIEGSLEDELLTFSQENNLTLKLSPECLTHLFDIAGSSPPFLLAAPSVVEVTIKQLLLPFAFLSPHGSAKEFSLDATLLLPHTEVETKGFSHPTLLKEVEIEIRSPARAELLTLQLHGDVLQDQHAFQVNFDFSVDKALNVYQFIDNLSHQTKIPPNFHGTHGRLTTTPFQFALGGKKEIWEVEDFICELEGPSLDQWHSSITARIHPKGKLEWAELFGDDVQLHMDCEFLAGKKDSPSRFTQLEGSLHSDRMEAQWQGELVFGQYIRLIKPLEANFSLTPRLIHLLQTDRDHFLTLESASPIRFQIAPVKIPLDKLQTTALKGEISAKELSFSHQLSVDKLDLPWEIDLKNHKIALSIDGITRVGETTPGKISGSLQVNAWHTDAELSFQLQQWNSHLDVENLPVELFSRILGRKELLTLLGDTLNIHARTDTPDKNSNTVHAQLTLEGPSIEGQLQLKIADAIMLEKPFTLQVKMTPARWEAMRSLLGGVNYAKAQSLKLLNDTTVSAVIHNFQIPRTKEEKFQFTGHFSIDQLKLLDTHFRPITFERFGASLESADLSHSIAFHVNLNEIDGLGRTYPLLFNGNIENFLSKEGLIDVDDLSLTLELKSQRLPASFLCQISGVDQEIENKLEALLGDTIDTHINAHLQHMNGPLNAELRGKNGKISLNAEITEGNLTLREPFKAEVAVTSQLAQTILQDVIPILGGAISAENAVTISIDPVGFILPLRTLAIDQIEIQKGKIDLGKMQFSNEGELGVVFELLKPSYQEALSVWFTPLYFKMEGGIIQLSRMDMLFMNRYPLALWGKVNAMKDKVDMRIGVTGAALKKALNLPNLADNEMLQIPLKGTTSSASIDKVRAAARISAFVAQQQGTAPGVLLGAVLDLAGGALLEDQPPEPTTQPFPWELSTTNGEHHNG